MFPQSVSSVFCALAWTDAIAACGSGMLSERTQNHQQVYEYKVHLAKLALMAHAVPRDVAAKVKTYLLSV